MEHREWIECNVCEGVGTLVCEYCNGTREAECHACYQMADCTECWGEGEEDCYACEGEGGWYEVHDLQVEDELVLTDDEKRLIMFMREEDN